MVAILVVSTVLCTDLSNHDAVHLKLTDHGGSTILKFKKKKKKGFGGKKRQTK